MTETQTSEQQRDNAKRYGVYFVMVHGTWSVSYVRPCGDRPIELGIFTGPDGVEYTRSAAGIMSDEPLPF